MTHSIRLRAAAVVLLVATGAARAQDSNRNEVRANLERGWSVVWGKNFTEADWARGLKAIAESVAAENPGPFLQWFEQTLRENFEKIERNLPGVARRDLENWIVQSLKQKRIVTYKGFKIEAGFATYNRWKKVSYDEPRTRQKKVKDPFGIGWTYVPEVYTERVEKKVPLPNWHQFYLRYQLVPSGGGGSSGGGGGNVAKDPVQLRYTIWNDTKQAVQFRLPTGKVYTLQPEARGSYHNTGPASAMRIHVLASGKTYALRNGDHKFWWIARENRIGFDLNYRK